MSTRDNMFKGQTTNPQMLTADMVIWSAWNRMGNKEVAREAAAKGHHINLAVTFLSKRLNLTEIETREWVIQEILLWVLELLKRRQVYKASHILSNIGLNSTKEITKIFVDTCNKDLRDYLGNHLMSVDKINDDILQSWHLLNSVINNNVFMKEEQQNLNINNILQRQSDWKCEVGSELFFKTYDQSLECFLKSKYMWTCLLKLNKPELLKFWINIQFSNCESYETTDIESITMDKCKLVFQLHSITPDLINAISNNELCIPLATQEIVLNELSKFGIFCEIEENDICCILKRLITTRSIENFQNVLSNNHSSINTINIRDFNNLVTHYCIDNKLYILLNAYCKVADIDYIKSNIVELIIDCKTASKNFNNLSKLSTNIMKVSKFLSDNLNINPLALLSVFVLNDSVSLLDIFSCKSPISIDNFVITDDLINNYLQSYTCVNLVFKKMNNLLLLKQPTLNVYDLLKLHADVNVDELFEFRSGKTKELPHFKHSDLVNKYGYNKRINFLFYLRQCRPCMASKVLLVNTLLNDKEWVVKKTLKLATRNFLNCDVAVSCVTFLELIDVSSNNLKVLLTIAKKLHDYKCCSEKNIQKLFDNVEINSQTILERLENGIETHLLNNMKLSKIDGLKLVEILKEYSIANKFAKIHNLKLPEKLLIFLAKNNMWLIFLLYVQQNDYPPDQVKKLILNFGNENYLEHINHSIINDTVIDEQKDMLMKERDSRKSFLSRIGVRQKMDLQQSSSSDGMSSSISSTTSLGSGASLNMLYSDLSENECFDSKPNLLQILIKCHNSSDPPKALLQACQHYKNPLLAILAASYEPDSVITNWIIWLTVSCKFCLCDENLFSCELLALNASAVSELMITILKKGFCRNLLYSFQVFLPENPLKTILEFLISCIELNCETNHLIIYLDQFKRQLNNASSNCIIISTDHEMSYINNKVWIEHQALIFISVILQYYFTSRYNQKQIIQKFCNIEIEKYFYLKCPKFRNVLLLLQHFDEYRIDMTIDLSVLYDSTLHKQNINQYINELLKMNEYKLALKIAKLENISPDNILIQQWNWKLKNITINYSHHDFWEKCNNAFINNDMSSSAAVNFYLSASKNVTENFGEKYTILKYAYEYSNRNRMSIMHDLERDMWIALFNIEDKNKKFESDVSMSAFFYTEMLDKLDTIQSKPSKLNEDLIKKLDKAIDDMLKKNDIFQALKLEKLFNHQNSELNIIKLMFSLAEKLILPYQLSPEERLLVNKAKRTKNLSHRRNFLSRISNISMSSYVSGSTSIIYIPDNNTESPAQDTLATLESLTEHINNGINIAERILMLYRISVNIEKEYHEVVTIKNPMNMLKEALENDCRNKLEVVHDFIKVYRWSKEEIAQFICTEIQSAAIKQATYNTDVVILWDMNINTDFHLILQLLPDNCSILGTKLYMFANSLHKFQNESPENYDLNTLSIIIELLIRAHSCFTTDCNMEGITLVLKKCQMIISILLTMQNWRLMVRLLTGVGRYTEMNYVFQILKENEQFEYLLRKGFSKDNALRIALLEYLKKFCPDNKELYRMVALHFALFSEVAQLWEKEADNYIKTLIEVSKLEMQNNKFNPDIEPFVLLQCNESTKITLNKAMVNYNHAAEYHLHGDKLAKALNSARQAELIALQISLISLKEIATICILNLTNSQLLYLITNKFSFPQARILVEAYNYPVDWSLIIFEQYIIRNQKEYLNDYMTYLPLNDTLVHNISRKFLNYKTTSANAASNMKNILHKLSSIHIKYRLASELGFLEVVEEILDGNQLSYLKDTVWKKGYKDT